MISEFVPKFHICSKYSHAWELKSKDLNIRPSFIYLFPEICPRNRLDFYVFNDLCSAAAYCGDWSLGLWLQIRPKQTHFARKGQHY